MVAPSWLQDVGRPLGGLNGMDKCVDLLMWAVQEVWHGRVLVVRLMQRWYVYLMPRLTAYQDHSNIMLSIGSV